MPDLQIERCSLTHPDALRLVELVQREYAVRYGGPDETPLDAWMFEPPGGAFFVGYVEGEPVATGAWRRRDDLLVRGSRSTAEIKRMYVVPARQREGVARRMLAHLESSARNAGAEVSVLETGEMQPEAIALYTSAGYEPIPAFGHYRDSPLTRCFGRRLV